MINSLSHTHVYTVKAILYSASPEVTTYTDRHWRLGLVDSDLTLRTPLTGTAANGSDRRPETGTAGRRMEINKTMF